jgi:hypothetical protein
MGIQRVARGPQDPNAVHRLNREILFLGVHEMKKRALLIGVLKTGSSNLCLAKKSARLKFWALQEFKRLLVLGENDYDKLAPLKSSINLGFFDWSQC